VDLFAICEVSGPKAAGYLQCGKELLFCLDDFVVSVAGTHSALVAADEI